MAKLSSFLNSIAGIIVNQHKVKEAQGILNIFEHAYLGYLEIQGDLEDLTLRV